MRKKPCQNHCGRAFSCASGVLTLAFRDRHAVFEVFAVLVKPEDKDPEDRGDEQIEIDAVRGPIGGAKGCLARGGNIEEPDDRHNAGFPGRHHDNVDRAGQRMAEHL